MTKYDTLTTLAIAMKLQRRQLEVFICMHLTDRRIANWHCNIRHDERLSMRPKKTNARDFRRGHSVK